MREKQRKKQVTTLPAEKPPSSYEHPSKQDLASVPFSGAAARHSLLPALLLGIFTLLAAAWIMWPHKVQPAAGLLTIDPVNASSSHSTGIFSSGAAAHIIKPTYTASPTPTSTPAPTSTRMPPLPSTPTFQPAAEDINNPPQETANPASYSVQAGDTLFKISQRLGVDMNSLSSINHITNPSSLAVGQQLVIPQQGYIPFEPASFTYSGNKRIVIDISEQHMYVFQGDSLLFSFIASTGMNNSTRVGTFSVLDKIPNAYGSNWDIWMPYWLGIYWSGNLQNGIHALPILPNGATLWEGYLGTPISYGCIVLGTYDAQVLYDWAEIGITVEIRW